MLHLVHINAKVHACITLLNEVSIFKGQWPVLGHSSVIVQLVLLGNRSNDNNSEHLFNLGHISAHRTTPQCQRWRKLNRVWTGMDGSERWVAHRTTLPSMPIPLPAALPFFQNPPTLGGNWCCEILQSTSKFVYIGERTVRLLEFLLVRLSGWI